MIDLLLIESRTTPSSISGTTRTEYLGNPITLRRAVFRESEVALSVPRAKAYWIPPAWSDIVDRLKMHGIAVERTSDAREVQVDMYRLRDPKFDPEPFEGHTRVSAQATIEHRKERFPPGSYRVATDQPLGELLTALLELESPDSFLQWGFFHSIFQRTEYAENYVVEAMAEIGVDSSKEFPKPLTDEVVRAADAVITMGCGDACPIFPGKRYEDWQLTDPAGQPIEVVRTVRDDIRTHVEKLVGELQTS